MSGVEKNKDSRREEAVSGWDRIHISCCHGGGGKQKLDSVSFMTQKSVHWILQSVGDLVTLTRRV